MLDTDEIVDAVLESLEQKKLSLEPNGSEGSKRFRHLDDEAEEELDDGRVIAPKKRAEQIQLNQEDIDVIKEIMKGPGEEAVEVQEMREEKHQELLIADDNEQFGMALEMWEWIPQIG